MTPRPEPEPSSRQPVILMEGCETGGALARLLSFDVGGLDDLVVFRHLVSDILCEIVGRRTGLIQNPDRKPLFYIPLCDDLRDFWPEACSRSRPACPSVPTGRTTTTQSQSLSCRIPRGSEFPAPPRHVSCLVMASALILPAPASGIIDDSIGFDHELDLAAHQIGQRRVLRPL